MKGGDLRCCIPESQLVEPNCHSLVSECAPHCGSWPVAWETPVGVLGAHVLVQAAELSDQIVITDKNNLSASKKAP